MTIPIPETIAEERAFQFVKQQFQSWNRKQRPEDFAILLNYEPTKRMIFAQWQSEKGETKIIFLQVFTRAKYSSAFYRLEGSGN